MAAGLATLAACDRTADAPLVGGAVLPDQPAYCYVTIADDDFYAAPLPGQEARLGRAWPPRAVPAAKAAVGAA